MLNIDQEKIVSLLRYDPDTGLFEWRTPKHGLCKKHPGQKGPKSKYGQIRINGIAYLTHRLAWVYVNGPIPDGMLVDHINGDTANNRLINLRLASKTENGYNCTARIHNRTGLKGVSYDRNTEKFSARITVSGKRINLGTFETSEEAHNVYREASRTLHKEFSRVE